MNFGVNAVSFFDAAFLFKADKLSAPLAYIDIALYFAKSVYFSVAIF